LPSTITLGKRNFAHALFASFVRLTFVTIGVNFAFHELLENISVDPFNNSLIALEVESHTRQQLA